MVMTNLEHKPGIKWKPPKSLLLDGDDVEEEWSIEHCRILYLISTHATAATADTEETWIRELALSVLIFEGIVSGCIDIDYSPLSLLISHNSYSRRIWMNVSMEGRSICDDLREGNMVNGLKLSTEDFQPLSAFQASDKGKKFLEILPAYIKNEVDAFIRSDDGSLFEVRYLPETAGFELVSSTGAIRESRVTEVEDVSYVSSPYLPLCLRKEDRFMTPFSTNAHRAHEVASAKSGVRDELDEAIILGKVMVLIGEWIPFGANQIVALNERLGALDRCQGGLFTSIVDENPTETQFDVPPGLSNLKILDFDFSRFINFEAEIKYPEDDGIIQIENFGMHINVDGAVVYGVFVEAIMNRKKDDISLDLLSRLLVDLTMDSTKIMEDIVSQYQKELLEIVFMGDSKMRSKFKCIVSEEIKPKVDAEDLLDKSDFENELKEVLGELRAAHDLGDKDLIVIGQEGALLTGPHSMEHQNLLSLYLSLRSREMFIRNFFLRCFVLGDLLSQIRLGIRGDENDPTVIAVMRQKLKIASRDVILLREVLQYLFESLQDFDIPDIPDDLNGKRLYKVLEPEQMKIDSMLRCTDLEKLIKGDFHQLGSLQEMSDVLNTKELVRVFKNVVNSTKFLVGTSKTDSRSAASLEVIQALLAGSFVFDTIDRISGGTLNINVPKWVEDNLIDNLLGVPFLFFGINILLLFVVCYVLFRMTKRASTMPEHIRFQVNRKISLPALEKYLAMKQIKIIETVHEFGHLRKESAALTLNSKKVEADTLSDVKGRFSYEDLIQQKAKYFESEAFLYAIYGSTDPQGAEEMDYSGTVLAPDEKEIRRILDAGVETRSYGQDLRLNAIRKQFGLHEILPNPHRDEQGPEPEISFFSVKIDFEMLPPGNGKLNVMKLQGAALYDKYVREKYRKREEDSRVAHERLSNFLTRAIKYLNNNKRKFTNDIPRTEAFIAGLQAVIHPEYFTEEVKIGAMRYELQSVKNHFSYPNNDFDKPWNDYYDEKHPPQLVSSTKSRI
eukprot:g5659.t1